jgi:hypothetical protein
VQTRYKEGWPYRVWVLPPGKANEALDTAVYALGGAPRHPRPAGSAAAPREPAAGSAARSAGRRATGCCGRSAGHAAAAISVAPEPCPRSQPVSGGRVRLGRRAGPRPASRHALFRGGRHRRPARGVMAVIHALGYRAAYVRKGGPS